MKTAIIDLQFGDTGKGRVSAYFCKNHKYDWSVRFNGGPNAGHTVYDDHGIKHKFNHLPAGAIFGKKVVLDSGMVIDIEGLKEELKILNRPIELYISENVHIIQPQHKEADHAGSGIGSTKKGIAYVYSDRSLRKGQRIGDVLWASALEKELNCRIYSGLPPVGLNDGVLYEGAQGIMLDVDYGCYPYVTSSSIMPSMVHKIDKIVGVMKSYVSRVGDGPPYTADVPELREVGKEFGTTTGRPRKCTWFNMADMKYALSIVQPDEIVVTKLDVLADLGKTIKMFDENYNIKTFDSLNSYENFLLEKYPKIKWFSKSPDGDLIKVQ